MKVANTNIIHTPKYQIAAKHLIPLFETPPQKTTNYLTNTIDKLKITSIKNTRTSQSYKKSKDKH
ncbi:hypothetical protein [Helicobacter cetorum]|uniref:hypothetical protein n=1 Tax=Helicobacter cetorum TaxID=138563 RepID=UPI000CF04132|nr:hypothetical protein [Helicobacter cetorum]